MEWYAAIKPAGWPFLYAGVAALLSGLDGWRSSRLPREWMGYIMVSLVFVVVGLLGLFD